MPAKSVTAAEFKDVMKFFYDEAWKVAAEEQFEDIFREQGPLFSFDNPTIHISADLSSIGIDITDKVPLPTWSGDLHMVIEHVHGTMTTAYQNHLLLNKNIKKAEAHMTAFETMFYNTITQESVEKDILSLRNTVYPLVANSDGGYISHTLT